MTGMGIDDALSFSVAANTNDRAEFIVIYFKVMVMSNLGTSRNEMQTFRQNAVQRTTPQAQVQQRVQWTMHRMTGSLLPGT